MVAGVEDAVIFADQFVLGILADGAEFVVHIGDGALNVRYRYDGVLIQSELLIRQLFQCPLVRSETAL